MCDNENINNNSKNSYYALSSRVCVRCCKNEIRVHSAVCTCCENLRICINGRKCCKLRMVLEAREYLSEHTPECKCVSTVLNPAALVPECVCKCRSKEKCNTAVPGVKRKVTICVLKVPYIVSDDELPSHIGPEHILLLIL